MHVLGVRLNNLHLFSSKMSGRKQSLNSLMRNWSCIHLMNKIEWKKPITYRSLVGTDLRGYFGFRGKAKVFGRRNVTLVRTLRVRVPNGPLITFFCTLRARTTAAVAFLFLAETAAFDGFFNDFTLAANLAPALVGCFLAAVAVFFLAAGLACKMKSWYYELKTHNGKRPTSRSLRQKAVVSNM